MTAPDLPRNRVTLRTVNGAGLISGSPLVPGTSTFTLEVSDSGATAQTTLKSCFLHVSVAPTTLRVVQVSPLTPGRFLISRREFGAV